jgi:AcrR family transcriptional regulator
MQCRYNGRKRVNKHQQKTEVTKRKLLRAARRIFARDGFEAARIDNIASEAGFTRGAFYAHFAAKEDLFFALLEQQSALHLDKLRELMEACASEQDRLETLRKYYSTRASDRQWSILVLEFKLFALRHAKLRAKLAEAHRRIRTQMKLASIQRVLPSQLQRSPESQELRRIVLEAVLNGLVLEHAYDPKGISEGQVASVLRKLFDTLVQGFEILS